MMRALLTAFLIWAAPGYASPVVVIDGDTIDIAGERIRLLEIDTPETFRSRCEAELVLGLKAKQRLRELLDAGEVSFERHGTDRFGRTLANVWVNLDDGPVDVSATLLQEGLALRYQPGYPAKRARLHVWCPSQ